jgi:hypothetical protein
LAAHLHCGDPELEDYARDYTIYVLAEYLCWAEIVRRDMRFLDLGGDNGNREFVRLVEINQLALSNAEFPKPLRLFRGQQRAIGELMMSPTGNPASAQYESIGYVEFCARLENDSAFSKWFTRLRDGLDHVVNSRAERSRFVPLQNGLIDLIEFLDPQQLRLPARLRDRLASSETNALSADSDLQHDATWRTSGTAPDVDASSWCSVRSACCRTAFRFGWDWCGEESGRSATA